VATSSLAILLISGDFERAHYAFMLACAGAALGHESCIFATNQGVRALCADWHGLPGAEADVAYITKGVAGFEELRESAIALDTRLMACEAGLRIAGVAARALLPQVQIAGIASFLEAATGAEVITL